MLACVVVVGFEQNCGLVSYASSFGFVMRRERKKERKNERDMSMRCEEALSARRVGWFQAEL